ncbi:MAG: hypothetical protein ABI670_10090 [Chloroflexota bacterium]
MTHDHSSNDTEQTNTAEGNVSRSAPTASDLHTQHEDDHGHGAHDDHGGHDTHGGDDDASERSTLVPTTWKQLIFPALILLLVGILVAGPLSSAFAPRPAAPAANGEGAGHTTEPTVAPTSAPGGSNVQTTNAQEIETAPPSTATSAPVVVARATEPPVEPTATAVALDAGSIATRTAVAVLGEQGDVSRAPVQLSFEGAQFAVEAGSGILPDWKPSPDTTRATWIQGTFANHVIYLAYSDANAALFSGAKQGDTVKLTMNNGQTFEFQVTRSERAFNGPSSSNGQFTVTTAMNQDHAGVTIFLIGDPAADRAVVQAIFTGNIQ